MDCEMSLLFVVWGGMWIVNGIMEWGSVFGLDWVRGDEIGDVNDVRELGKLG